MDKTYLMVIAAALLAAPLAFAHSPAGTPKNYCEHPSEWDVHEYVGWSTGPAALEAKDGNVVENCNGFSNLGYLCIDPADPLHSPVICEFDPPLAEYDGHKEFSVGGAVLLNCESFCGPTGIGSGTITCFGEAAHHPTPSYAWDPYVSVDDIVFGYGVPFSVGIDGAGMVGTGTSVMCGDGLMDQWQECIGYCGVTFPAGLDGAYYVFVQGTAGHVYT
jgi:hypothetical protein